MEQHLTNYTFKKINPPFYANGVRNHVSIADSLQYKIYGVENSALETKKPANENKEFHYTLLHHQN